MTHGAIVNSQAFHEILRQQLVDRQTTPGTIKEVTAGRDSKLEDSANAQQAAVLLADLRNLEIR